MVSVCDLRLPSRKSETWGNKTWATRHPERSTTNARNLAVVHVRQTKLGEQLHVMLATFFGKQKLGEP